MTWREQSIAWMTCWVTLILPARVVLLLFRYIHRRDEEHPGALRGVARIWNIVLLGFVFVVGLPLAKISLALKRRPPTSGTNWIPRASPEELARDIEAPF